MASHAHAVVGADEPWLRQLHEIHRFAMTGITSRSLILRPMMMAGVAIRDHFGVLEVWELHGQVPVGYASNDACFRSLLSVDGFLVIGPLGCRRFPFMTSLAGNWPRFFSGFFLVLLDVAADTTVRRFLVVINHIGLKTSGSD